MKKSTALIALILSIAIAATACGKEPSTSDAPAETTISTAQGSPADTTTSKAPISDTSAAETTAEVTSVVTVPAVPIVDAMPDICSSKYGYYTLNADEKATYDQLLIAATNFEENVVLKRKLPRESFIKVMKIMRMEEDDLYYLERTIRFNTINGNAVDATLRYMYTKTEVKNLNNAVNEKINTIFKEIPANASPMTKIKIFHDKIILNCDYSLSYKYRDTPYGALVSGEALCEGYARAFALLCNKAGIENLYTTGIYNNIETDIHMWNMVKLDGDWYNIDLTWDDPPYDGADKLPDYFIRYNYFMYKNDQSGVNLVVDNSLFTVPETNSSKYNYFIYYGYYAKSYDQAVEILSKQIKYALDNNKKYVRIRFASTEMYEEAKKRLFEDSEIFNETITPPDKIKTYQKFSSDSLHIFQLELNPINQ